MKHIINFSKEKFLIIKGYGAAITAAVLFGSVSSLSKPTLSDINPILLSSMVYLIAATTMIPIVKVITRQKNIIIPSIFSLKREDYFLITAIALFGAVIAPTLYFFGLKQALASNASVLLNGEMAFTVLFTILFFEEKLDRIGYVGIVLIFVGLIIVSAGNSLTWTWILLPAPSSLNSLQESISNFRVGFGDMLILLSTLFWAVDNNISKILTQRVNIARIVQLKSAIGGTILLLITVLFVPQFIPIVKDITLSQIPNIVALGVSGFAASIFFFLYGLRIIGTVKTIIIFSTSSIFGVVFAALLLNESIDVYKIGISIGIIISGIYLVNKRSSER
jgi:drug/metabolite transporter (DMT)-like permease